MYPAEEGKQAPLTGDRIGVRPEPAQVKRAIDLAVADHNRDRVVQLTAYAEQESAYALNGGWGNVARHGREALEDMR
jgi:hypothetical protein